MNLQRNAATFGAFLAIVLLTFFAAVLGGAVAGVSGSGEFGLVIKTVLALGLMAIVLDALMKWGHGGSMSRWLVVALAAYVVTPSSWTGHTLFTQALGTPSWVAFVADGILWAVVAWFVAKRVLPEATKDDSIDRLR